jgi:hypothetical protein
VCDLPARRVPVWEEIRFELCTSRRKMASPIPLRMRAAAISPRPLEAYVAEGRLLVVELMGQMGCVLSSLLGRGEAFATARVARTNRAGGRIP